MWRWESYKGSLEGSLVYSAKIQGHPVASVPGRCWAGGRASAQGKEKDVGREGTLRLMSETLSPVKWAVPSAPETAWCYDEPCGSVFTVREQLMSQKQCLLILVLEERLSDTPWQAAQWRCGSICDPSEQSSAEGTDVNSGWLLSISVPTLSSPSRPPLPPTSRGHITAASMQLMEGEEQTTGKWRVNLDENVTHEFWPKHSLIQRKANINIYRLKNKSGAFGKLTNTLNMKKYNRKLATFFQLFIALSGTSFNPQLIPALWRK